MSATRDGLADGAAGTELSDFRAALRRWLEEEQSELQPYRALTPDLDEQFALFRGFSARLYAAGWVRRGWQEEFGGLGGSGLYRGVLAEELAMAGYPLHNFHGLKEVLGPAVARFGPNIASWALPRLLSTDDVWCQGFSEPEAGSDLGSLRLRAESAGDHWRVNGQKVWTSGARYANRCVLLARTGTREEAHRGITALFVDMDAPGIAVRDLRAMNGDSEFGELFFDDVLVPKDRTIGRVGDGWALAMYVLSSERGAWAWERQAWLHRRFRELLERNDADPRATSFAGDTFALLYAMRLVSRRSIYCLARGEEPGAASSVDKVLMASTEQAIFDGYLELFPHAALLDDDRQSDAWRSEFLYSRAASIYGGTGEIQRNLIAERLVGLPREE